MKNKKQIVSLVLLLLVIAIGATGCAQKKKSTTYSVKTEPVSISYSASESS